MLKLIYVRTELLYASINQVTIFRGTQYGPEVSGLTYKSRAKWKMLWGIYSVIYGEVNL